MLNRLTGLAGKCRSDGMSGIMVRDFYPTERSLERERALIAKAERCFRTGVRHRREGGNAKLRPNDANQADPDCEYCFDHQRRNASNMALPDPLLHLLDTGFRRVDPGAMLARPGQLNQFGNVSSLFLLAAWGTIPPVSEPVRDDAALSAE